MWAIRGSPDSGANVPSSGADGQIGTRTLGARTRVEEVAMKLIKRIAVAVGSLAALALAGGAHMRF